MIVIVIKMQIYAWEGNLIEKLNSTNHKPFPLEIMLHAAPKMYRSIQNRPTCQIF